MTGTPLRLRTDAYYVPVPEGVWIRTTDGSFTLIGKTVATWVEKLAPLLDRGVVPDELLRALRPDQADFVGTLLRTLEQRRVLLRSPAEDVPEDSPLVGAFPQQVEFLRHFTVDPAAGLGRVRAHPLAVVGPADRAGPLAAALMETGFGDIAMPDAAADTDLRELADDLAHRAVPVHLSGAEAGLRGRTLVGLFPAGAEDDAWRFLARAESTDGAAWAGLVRGQALLLKGQVPRSGHACVRCAWRRLAHQAVDLPPADRLGHVPVSVAAAVIAQELFRHVAARDDSVLGEGVVVDLTRLSIWRTEIDPDPGCPGHGVHAGSAHPGIPPRPPRRTAFPESVFGARCFGPLLSCAPEQLPQSPLTALRVRCNPPGRTEPVGSGSGPVVVAETMSDARAEAALIAVESALPAAEGTVVGAGRESGEALARALLRWADTGLAGTGPGDTAPGGTGLGDTAPEGVPATDRTVLSERARGLAGLAGTDHALRSERHPSGLWRAWTDRDVMRTGFDPAQAQERALMAALALEQFGPDDGAHAVPAWTGAVPEEGTVRDVAAALGLSWSVAALPPLVSGRLTGVVLAPGAGR
ncbi:hypothetical protein Ppa06_60090 [Planomonospora parontospora subsp. parontospora]|uniref:Uncharacterized protein n=2 Tax=Planomonospora parontospora TaxID=58119 RepID=A0AA37BK10_9ACTN|nr:hypothetical protein [Planomonospora parontospora]GGK82771.1 hypothetical protein GCM10010126_47680 [Planomonospora parontospora]GII12211.1 hypothetical protein Ppa06_60090 [Planomonospora parontospora subsp. parontospora]